MNLHELDSYNLADAVKFHNRLNPRLWDKTEHLLPEVHNKLLEIAADFQEFLGVPDLDVVDITVSGSNAAYSYTPHSDIDLHLVVRMPEQNSEVFQELFNAKKYQYNDEHDIRIGGADVELYVQPADQKHHSLGIYSVKNNDWVQVPRRRKIELDDQCVSHKTEDLAARIDQAMASGSEETMQRLWDKIKTMRQTGLEQAGEFGCDNLVFKMLRRSGHIERLTQAKTQAHDRELSLTEKKKRKKAKKKFTYGAFGGWFYPGYNFNAGETGDAGGGDGGGGESVREVDSGIAQGSAIGDAGAQSTWDGVSPDTDEYLSEEAEAESIVRDFIRDTARRLGIKKLPRVRLHKDNDWSENAGSFGRYVPETHELHVNMADRHIMDILRTTAHELAHCRQHELSPLPDNAGETGSRWENQAHATAGVIMRDYADAHPEMFDKSAVIESSGYIPTAAQKNDPRFVMALSPDVRPGATGKNANKMALKTDAQGRPALLMKTVNLREGRMPQPSQGQGRYRDLNQPLGPETPPTMPAGTVRVDVSDVYDWYKLGQHISNMKGLGKHDFGAGPPSSIISFGDEETEHKFIQDLKRTGLDVTDIDPKDPKQPAGMRPIKTDPTYNVAEAFDQPYKLKWEKSEYGDYDALATLDDGTHLSIMFEHTTPYEVAVSFWRNNSQEVTGEGDAQRIFATVLAAIQQFLKQEQPANITFSAVKQDDPSGSRSKLYNKLVQRYAGTWGYQARSFDHSDKVEFELTKIRQNVDEDDIVASLRQEFALLEDEYLGEIKMTGKNLRAEAAKTGAVAGMEFEMIVPNVEAEELDPEYEPDYDQDQRARSFSDVRDFFYDGDYNSRRDVDNLIDELQNEYLEWQSEQTSNAWDRDGPDVVREYIANNNLFDRDEAMDQATEEFAQANPDIDIGSDEALQGIAARVDELENEFAQTEFEDRGRIYDAAFEEFSEEQADEYDERSFLDDKYPYMTDVQNGFDISWPYYIDINDGRNSGDMDVDQVADNFSRAIGKPVNASRQYHGGRREAGHYVVEPDGSLEADNPGDGGLEFVSPPMPIDEMIADLNKVKAWADKTGCYTNDSTGLHINISVPNYTLAKLDYVKLALLMGDEYVLELFGRSGNTYAKSAIDKIKTMLQRNPDIAPQVMEKMREHMEDLATKAIHSGTTDKYTSINTKTGYIEFRSPGGDWLDANFSKIEDTLLRFTVALSAAIDPQAYRQEYLKKLYKLLESSQEKGGPDVLQLFANYSAGELDKAALIRQVRQKQLARNVEKGKITGKMWWRVGRPGYGATAEVVASSKEEAIEKGKAEYPDWRDAQDMTAKPLRPYEEPAAQTDAPGNWGIWINAVDRFANQPGSYSRNETPPLYRFPTRAAAEQWIEQQRAARPNMRSDIEVREIEPAVQDTGSATSGNWGVWVAMLDRYAEMNVDGQSVTRRFENRAGAEAWVQDYNTRHPGNGLALVAQEIEPAAQEPQGVDTSVDYEIYNRETGEVVDTTQLRNDDEARIRLDDYRSHGPHRLNRDQAERTFGIRRGPGVANTQTDVNPLRPTGPGPWEVANRANNQVYYNPPSTYRRNAESEARTWLSRNGHNPNDFEVRTREGVGGTDAARGGIIDIEPDISPYTAPRTLTVPGQGQQVFTGEWKVLLPNGREVYRFSGVGNSQSDANRVAAFWLRQNGYGVSGEGFEVLPVMG